MRVLVTGATGFVGAAACDALRDAGHTVRRALRRDAGARDGDVVVGELDEGTAWERALEGMDAVVHLAARVHMLRDPAPDPMREYHRVNTAATERLARSAAAAGVRRFVYASTIKVNGERTPAAPFRADDAPGPTDPYGRSKLAAERALHDVAAATGLVVGIVRPPLVYGPGVKGNFASMLRWVDRRLPLPLGAVRNRRSLVGLTNLASLLRTMVESPALRAGAARTFLVSDDEDLSTPALLRRVARAMGHRLWLPPVPTAALRGAAAMLGRGGMADRLADSLYVDIADTRATLGWAPVSTVDAELARTVAWYRAR